MREGEDLARERLAGAVAHFEAQRDRGLPLADASLDEATVRAHFQDDPRLAQTAAVADAMILCLLDTDVTHLRVHRGNIPTAELRIGGEWSPVPGLSGWVLADRVVLRHVVWQLETIGDLDTSSPAAWSWTRVTFGRGRERTFHSVRVALPVGSTVLFSRMALAEPRGPDIHGRAWQTIQAFVSRGHEALVQRRLAEGRQALQAAIDAATALGDDFRHVLVQVLVQAAVKLDQIQCLEAEAIPLLERARAVAETASVPALGRIDLLDACESAYEGLARYGDVRRIIEERERFAASAFGTFSVPYIDARFARVHEHLRREEGAEALDVLEPALASGVDLWGTDEAIPWALCHRADARRLVGDLDRAHEDALRALAIAEAAGHDVVRYLGVLANVEERMGAHESAAGHLRRAIEQLDPQSAELPNGIAIHVQLARVLGATDRAREAQALLDHAASKLGRLRPAGHPDLGEVERELMKNRARLGPYR